MTKEKAKKKHEDTTPVDLDQHPIGSALNDFLSSIEDYREATITALPNAAKNRMKALKKCSKKLSKYDQRAELDNMIKLEKAHQVTDLISTLKKLDLLENSNLIPLMARSFFIGIFTEYDKFIGNLLDAIYTKKPDLYKSIKKEISLSELINISNIEEVKKNILEEEIDSFRRGSYVEQFSDLENKFDIKTLKKFKEWPQFIECAQRRNLMTHNGGYISHQYINICKQEGYNFKEAPQIGQKLELDPEYLFNTLRNVSKIGFMLTHTLWRKIFPDEVDIADRAMNESIFFLLEAKRWKMASEFGEFSMSSMMSKETSSMLKMIRIVNTALCLKHNGNQEQASKLLDEVDWSASIRDFKLAVAIINDNFEEASEIMIDIGKTGELINELAYYQWPLFEEFRGSSEFQVAFKEIYGTEFRSQIKIAKIKTSKKTKKKTKKKVIFKEHKP